MLIFFTIFSKDLDNLIPLTVRGLPTYKAQHWLNRIHDELKGTVMRRTPPECMAKFVGMFLISCAECSGSVGRALDWGSKGC